MVIHDRCLASTCQLGSLVIRQKVNLKRMRLPAIWSREGWKGKSYLALPPETAATTFVHVTEASGAVRQLAFSQPTQIQRPRLR